VAVQKWEYLQLSLPHSREKSDKIAGEQAGHVVQIEAILNELGNQGWEVVGYSATGSHYFTLKRPKP
jgi:hypothetical protein